MANTGLYDGITSPTPKTRVTEPSTPSSDNTGLFTGGTEVPGSGSGTVGNPVRVVSFNNTTRVLELLLADSTVLSVTIPDANEDTSIAGVTFDTGTRILAVVLDDGALHSLSIPTGNINADFNSTTGDSHILNQPVNATTSIRGYMSPSDKSKLNTVETNAEVNRTKAEVDALNLDYTSLSNKPRTITESEIAQIGINTLKATGVKKLATDPAPLVEGEVWYNTAANELRYYDGTVVKVVADIVDLFSGSYNDLTNVPTDIVLDWKVGGTYVSGDRVWYDDDLYRANGDATVGQVPTPGNTRWDAITDKVDDYLKKNTISASAADGSFTVGDVTFHPAYFSKAYSELTGRPTTITPEERNAIITNTAKVSNATHTGDVTGSTSLGISNNVVDEVKLKISNDGTNGYFLQKQSGNEGGMTWAPSGSSGEENVQSNWTEVDSTSGSFIKNKEHSGIIDVAGVGSALYHSGIAFDDEAGVETTLLVNSPIDNTTERVHVTMYVINTNIAEINSTTFTVTWGGVIRTFTLNSGYYSQELIFTGLTNPSTSSMTISKNEGGSLNANLKVVLDHTGTVAVTPATEQYLDDNYLTWGDYKSGLYVSDLTESNGSTTIKLQFGGSNNFVYRNIIDTPYTDTIYREPALVTELAKRGG